VREAVAAVQQLQSTMICGNKRFIDVLPRGGGDPPANLFLSGGKGAVGGMPANAFGNCCVFVRGFDFGTTEEQRPAHVSKVGSIMSATWIDNGSAEVTYSSAHVAAVAVQQFHGTTIMETNGSSTCSREARIVVEARVTFHQRPEAFWATVAISRVRVVMEASHGERQKRIHQGLAECLFVDSILEQMTSRSKDTCQQLGPFIKCIG